MKDNYHFHRECMYYAGCKITEEKKGGLTHYRVKCPVDKDKPGKGTLYNSMSDFENLRVSCVGFIPIQQTFDDLMDGGSEK